MCAAFSIRNMFLTENVSILNKDRTKKLRILYIFNIKINIPSLNMNNFEYSSQILNALKTSPANFSPDL